MSETRCKAGSNDLGHERGCSSMAPLSWPRRTGWRSRAAAVLAQAVVIAILAGSGCSGSAPDEDWVARVGSQHIAAAALEAEMARALARYERNGTPVPLEVEQALRAHLRERMIEDEILYQQAMARGLRIGDAALDAAEVANRARFRSAAAYAAHIQDTYGDAERARAALRRRLLIEHAIDVLAEELAPGTDAPADQGAADLPATEAAAMARRRQTALAAVAPSVDVERRDPATALPSATSATR